MDYFQCEPRELVSGIGRSNAYGFIAKIEYNVLPLKCMVQWRKEVRDVLLVALQVVSVALLAWQAMLLQQDGDIASSLHME